MNLLKAVVAVGIALTIGAGTANAGSIVYTLDSTEVAGFGAAPYGSVTLTENGGNVDFIVDLASGFKFVTTGNTNSHALFALNGLNVFVADIVGVTNNTSSTFSVYANATAQPFGKFDFGIKCTSCANGAPGSIAGPLEFTVKSAVLGDFVDLSSKGAYFSADVIKTSNGKTGQIGTKTAGTPVKDVPVPDAGTSLSLLGCSLAMLGLSRQFLQR